MAVDFGLEAQLALDGSAVHGPEPEKSVAAIETQLRGIAAKQAAGSVG